MSRRRCNEKYDQLNRFYSNKQYKYRLKQWGVRKNLNTAELDQMQHYSATGREMRLPTVNGREIGSKRLKSLAASDQKRRTARRCIAPLRVGVNHISDSFRTAEMDLRAATTHTMQQCEAASERTWRNPVTAPGCRWYGDMLLAILRLRGKSEVDAGFQLIDKCCAGYKTVLQTGDPLLLWFTYSSILELSQNGMNLATAFARFVAGLCAIEKGRTHPLTILLTNVLKTQVGRAYNRDNIARVVEAQFYILVDKYEGAWKKLCLVYLRLTLQRLTGRGSPTQEQAVTCPNTLPAEDITQKCHTDQYARKSRKMVPWMQMSKAMTFVDRGDYMRASMTLGDEGYSDA
jgi:hypothetical protein